MRVGIAACAMALAAISTARSTTSALMKSDIRRLTNRPDACIARKREQQSSGGRKLQHAAPERRNELRCNQACNLSRSDGRGWPKDVGVCRRETITPLTASDAMNALDNLAKASTSAGGPKRPAPNFLCRRLPDQQHAAVVPLEA